MTLMDETTTCLHGHTIAPGSRFGRERVSLEPASAYEMVTRQMVLNLSEDLHEIKARLNGLLFMVVGAVILEVITRVMG
jgi:hypothetical protein